MIDGPGWRRLKSLVNIGAKKEKSSEAGKKTLRCTNVEQKNSNDLKSEQQTRKTEKKKEKRDRETHCNRDVYILCIYKYNTFLRV
jgi:hypothetical protein